MTIGYQSDEELENEVSRRSSRADLVIAGLPAVALRGNEAEEALQRYRSTNEVLFVSGAERIPLADRAARGT